MISLKVNDIVFLENVGVHARVEAVDVLAAVNPPLLKLFLNDGGDWRCGRCEGGMLIGVTKTDMIQLSM